MKYKSIIFDNDTTSDQYRSDLANELKDAVFVRLGSWKKSPTKNFLTVVKLLGKADYQNKHLVVFSFGAKNNLILCLLMIIFRRVKFVPTVNGLGRFAPTGYQVSIYLKIYLALLSYLSSAVITQNSRDFNLVKHKSKYLAYGSGIPASFLNEKWKKTTSSKKTFAYVGRAEKSKGIYLFLKIAKLFPEYNFNVYSKLNEELQTKLMMKKNKNVTFCGFTEKKLIFKKTDVVIFPSEYGEGIARVVLEALSSNTFVISTKIPGNLDLVRKFGMDMKLLPIGSSMENYRVAIKNYMEIKDPERAKILTSNKKKSFNLSSANIAVVYNQVIRDLHGSD